VILIEWDLYAILYRRVYLVLSTTSYTITGDGQLGLACIEP
jgi:hypothetical protein